MQPQMIVCIKSVIRSAPDGVGRRTPENSELNPFDRPALEAALRLKQTLGGTITALSMGPPLSVEALAEAQAMGTDRAVLISDPALAGSDTLVTARVLAAAVQRLAPFTFVLFGTRSADSDTGQVGPQTATLLKLPFISGVKSMAHQDGRWEIRRLMDDWEEQWQLQPPAALSIHARAFRPRPIALTGIAAAYEQLNIERLSLADLNLPPELVGLAGSPTRVSRLQKVKRHRTCRMIEGEPRQQAAALIEHLTQAGIVGT